MEAPHVAEELRDDHDFLRTGLAALEMTIRSACAGGHEAELAVEEGRVHPRW